MAPGVCGLLIYLQFAVDSLMIAEDLGGEGKGSPKLCIFVLITLRITESKPLFAAIIRHAVLACSKTGNVGSSSHRDMDYMFI